MVKMVVENEEHVGPVWNVIGMVPGALPEDLDRPVILGNHRDAWVFGAVGEPCSDRAGDDGDEAGVVLELCPTSLLDFVGLCRMGVEVGTVAARLLGFWAHVLRLRHRARVQRSIAWRLSPKFCLELSGPSALL